MTNALHIHGFDIGPWRNRMYLIGNKQTKTCAVVDPAWHTGVILKEAEKQQMRITQILCTHSHADHTDRVGEVQAITQASVHMLEQEVKFANFRARALQTHQAGESLDVSGEKLTFVHTPGHTPGSACFHLEQSKTLVTGDTLFVGGCGRCDFEGGDPHAMHTSLHHLVQSFSLETRVLPGHDYGETQTSTLGHERKHNPFFLAPTQEAFVAKRMEGKTTEQVSVPELPAWAPTGLSA